MTPPHPKDALVREFQEDIESSFESGRWNHLWNTCLTIGGVVASLVATVLLSTEVPRPYIALITALPAAFATIQTTLAFRRKSHWYFIHATKVGALRMELRFDPSPNLQEYANRRAQIGLDMEGHWGKIEDEAAAAVKDSAKDAHTATDHTLKANGAAS
jgi:hypothetical protein